MNQLAQEHIARRARLGMPVITRRPIVIPRLALAEPAAKAPIAKARVRRPKPRPVAAVQFLQQPTDPIEACIYMQQWRIIAREVAAKHGVPLTSMFSSRRDRPSVAARQEAFWRCKQETTMSLPEIGRRFGGKDHTTVIHGIRKHEMRLAEAKYLTGKFW